MIEVTCGYVINIVISNSWKRAEPTLASAGLWARGSMGTTSLFIPISPFPRPRPLPYHLSSFSFPLSSYLTLSLLPSPFSPILGAPPPLVQLRGLVSAVSSPSRSGRNPAAKRFVVHFELKQRFW